MSTTYRGHGSFVLRQLNLMRLDVALLRGISYYQHKRGEPDTTMAMSLDQYEENLQGKQCFPTLQLESIIVKYF